MPKPLKKQSAPKLETITRTELVIRLRNALAKFTDIENSICKVAAERGIFCNGFNQYGDEDLRRRYDWIVKKRPDLNREQLEVIANDWQLAQQEVYELPIACDVQQTVRDTCRGWSDFTNEQLAKFYFQVTGQEVAIA
ncbi:MAG TPA: hypothetical protein VF980_01105 [Thermoanaerobaculia bacterium]